MTRFSDALAKAQVAVDGAFAERIMVEPHKVSEYVASIPSPDVGEFEIMGIADLDGQTVGVTGTRYKAKIDANLRGDNAVISVLNSYFNGRHRPMPSKGWIFRMIDRDPVVRFRVSTPRPDGKHRTHFVGEVVSG